jgi:hypothetical protein
LRSGHSSGTEAFLTKGLIVLRDILIALLITVIAIALGVVVHPFFFFVVVLAIVYLVVRRRRRI